MSKLSDVAYLGGNMVEKEQKNNSSASFYALHVALQTMKERCQQLQQRLSAVEEENFKLRIERQRLSVQIPDECKGEISSLHEHVAQLTKQKAQLTHHIFMVATENKQLWTRLLRLIEANHSLGSQLTKISDTLNKHSLGESSKPYHSIQIMNSYDKQTNTVEKKDESLEEISLKIISSIIREKIELEQQCDQMSALQAGTLSVEDCEFTLGADGREQEELGHDLRKVFDGLREQKETLQRQQARLRTILTTLTSLVKYGMPCKRCKNGDTSKPSDSGLSPNREEHLMDQQVKDVTGVSISPTGTENNRFNEGDKFEDFNNRICPICSISIHPTVDFEEFNSHVLAHFVDEDTESDSFMQNDYQTRIS